jgi:hypothetical protein
MRLAKIVVISLILLSGAACRNEMPIVPEQLIGTWVTSDPRYAGRALEVTHTQIKIAQSGSGTQDLQQFLAINRKSLGRATLFTFMMQGKDEGQTRLTFEYDPAEGGTIRFPNQTPVWRREIDSPP